MAERRHDRIEPAVHLLGKELLRPGPNGAVGGVPQDNCSRRFIDPLQGLREPAAAGEEAGALETPVRVIRIDRIGLGEKAVELEGVVAVGEFRGRGPECSLQECEVLGGRREAMEIAGDRERRGAIAALEESFDSLRARRRWSGDWLLPCHNGAPA